MEKDDLSIDSSRGESEINTTFSFSAGRYSNSYGFTQNS